MNERERRRQRELEREFREQLHKARRRDLGELEWSFLRTRTSQLHPRLQRLLDEGVWDAIGESAEKKTPLKPNLVATRYDHSGRIIVVAALPQFLEACGWGR